MLNFKLIAVEIVYIASLFVKVIIKAIWRYFSEEEPEHSTGCLKAFTALFPGTIQQC